MALSDGNIAVVRNYLRKIQQYDNITSQCNIIKQVLDSNVDYYNFCIGTGIGNEFNEKINELIRILTNLSSTTSSLISSTNSYLNNQAEINRQVRLESQGVTNE